MKPARDSVLPPPDPWLLLAEQRHRTKNLLQLMNSLLNHAIGDDTSEADMALRRVQTQIASFGLLNDVLDDEQVRDAGIPCCARYLAAIAELIEASCLKTRGIALRLSLPATLPADATLCRYLGLILTELLFNAVKHAFPTGGGTIVVRLGAAAGHLHLHVADDGVGSGRASHGRGGLGRTFIQTLARALQATVDCHSSPHGTTCDVRVALPAGTGRRDRPVSRADVGMQSRSPYGPEGKPLAIALQPSRGERD